MENFEKKDNVGVGDENDISTTPVNPSQEVNNDNFVPNNNIEENKPNNKSYTTLVIVLILVVVLGVVAYFYI